MDANQIRTKFFDFLKRRGHVIIPRANLVPQDDPTTLFTGSGMQPLVPYLLGADHPEGNRLANSQTCFRAEDIDEVGDNRHTTFFEMLGNWSLGDYFKAEQLRQIFEFLTNEVELKPARLYATVFSGDAKLDLPRDDEAAEIWEKLFKGAGISTKRVEMGSIDAAAQKGMQDGRIFYYDASKNWWSRSGKPQEMPSGEPGGPDSELFYEIDGVEHNPEFGVQCHPNCDCGRFVEVANSVFMQYLKTEDGFKELPKKNVDFGGGLERVAMAAIDSPDIFKISVIWPLVEKLEELSGKKYADNQFAMRVIADHVRGAVFLATDGVVPSNKEQGYVLRRFLRRAIRQGLILDIKADLLKQLVPVVVKMLVEPYPELGERETEVEEILTREEQTFRQTLERGVREFKKLAGKKLTGETVFKLFDTYGFPSELSIEEAGQLEIAIDDNWPTDFDQLMAEQRERSRTATAGQFKGGLADQGDITTKYHTATHLMYKALREVLGDHIVQRGSNITAERTRFDFSHPDKMTPEEIQQVEDLVNAQIKKDLPVSFEELPVEAAFKSGAIGAFGEKYPDIVKVYTAGDPKGEWFSREICGGPHVAHTGELGHFKITKEESSSAGVRRVKAVLE